MVSEGMEVAEGQVIATVGDKSVNGGWEPHLHFNCHGKNQKEMTCRSVARSDRDWALEKYPDPGWF